MNEQPVASSSIRAKVERSSLGTPEARRERALIADSDARVIVSRAAAYPTEVRARDRGGQSPCQHLYQGAGPIQPRPGDLSRRPYEGAGHMAELPELRGPRDMLYAMTHPENAGPPFLAERGPV